MWERQSSAADDVCAYPAQAIAAVASCGLLVMGDPLEQFIGRRVRFIRPQAPACEGPHTIICVQRVYSGEVAFRVIGDWETVPFGRPALTTEVEFLP